MPMTVFGSLSKVLIEAEVAHTRVNSFIDEYRNATGVTLTPKTDFQVVQDKYGLEGRVYFDATVAQAAALTSMGYNVEGPTRTGYRGDEYTY